MERFIHQLESANPLYSDPGAANLNCNHLCNAPILSALEPAAVIGQSTSCQSQPPSGSTNPRLERLLDPGLRASGGSLPRLPFGVLYRHPRFSWFPDSNKRGMKGVEVTDGATTAFRPRRFQVLESDGTAVDITGYSFSFIRSALVFLGYVFTCGLLRLLFHWLPHWMLLCTHETCPLQQAQKVLIKDSSGVYYVHQVMVSNVDGVRGDFLKPRLNWKAGTALRALRLQMNQDRNVIIYFIHKRMKYVWDRSGQEFSLLRGWEERPYCELIPATPLTPDVVIRRRALYEPNEIDIQITPLLKMMVSECLNPFYCFQAVSCALWYWDDYYVYASVIVILSTLSLMSEVIETRRNERSLKRTVTSSSVVSVCRNINGVAEFQSVNSTELVPGDVIEIPRSGCMMQCDALVLSGNCIVNESTLTGESVPVTKTPLQEDHKKHDIFSVAAEARHVLFGGTKVIQTRNYADEPVLAVVARTGFRTAKGELVRSILFPKPMKFKFTQDSFKFIGALSVLAAVGFFISVYLMHLRGKSTTEIVLRACDLVTIVVPPALPMAMTVGVIFAQRRLRAHNIYCVNPSAINVCGIIDVVCFDKTGTITEDGLDLWGVVPNDHGNFGEPEFHPSEFKKGPLLECMATCHSLTRIEGVLSGDPLDLKMFQSTKWEFLEEGSEDHCKFGMAVPAVVRPRQNGSMTNITLESTFEADVVPYEIGIIRQFAFTSSLQRMSVIARVLTSSHFSIYTKGAPETIETLCRRDTIPSDFHSTLLEYTREGYRVLALAWRPLKIPYTRALRIQRERAEQDLLFLGLLVMENRLKPESAPVIQVLKNANIRPVMVTGDNMLTAVSVARDCEMIYETDRVIVVSAKPPPKPNACKSSNATGDGDGGGPGTSANPDLPFLFSGGPALYPGQDAVPLVEFHYAEDLYKPVTEVTATNAPAARDLKPHNEIPNGVPYTPARKQKNRLPWGRRNRSGDRSAFYSALSRDQHEVSTGISDPSDTPPDTGGGRQSPAHVERLTSHHVTIRMIDRPDFHLAISGKTWAIIKDHYPWLIPKLVVKGTVFARFSPEEKAQLIEALQSVGYFVAMCGDGANDCGALKAAHAGVSLSEAEASVASPFTAKEQNIKCIPTLIREGRCALVTSFGTFKFMAGYSLVQFFSVILLYIDGSNISDLQYLYIDLFLITSLSVTFGYTKPYPDLIVEPPRMRLLSFITLTSLALQFSVNLAIQVVAFMAVRSQPWYLPLWEINDYYELYNYESSAVFTVAAYQYIALAVVFAKGAPYRRSLLSNPWFVLTVVGMTIFTAVLTSNTVKPLLELISLVHMPFRFVLLLHGLVFAGFLVCYLLELIVDGLAFRRQLLRIRKVLFPRHVQMKVYERIREEIDKMAGSWPPVIRPASIQALPTDLFNDGDIAVPGGAHPHERASSDFTSDNDEEEVVFQNSAENHDSSALLRSHAESAAGTHRTANGGAVADPPRPDSTRKQKRGSHFPMRRHSFDDIRLDFAFAVRQTTLSSNRDSSHIVGDRNNINRNVLHSSVAFCPIDAQYPPSNLPYLCTNRHRSKSSGPEIATLFVPPVTRLPHVSDTYESSQTMRC